MSFCYYNKMEPKLELHPALEAEISRLSAEVLRRREEGRSDLENLKQSLGESQEKTVPQKPRESQTEPSVLPGYATDESPETRLYVESVIDKLWHEGDLDAAWKEAEKGGPLALDLFHDALAGKFHDIMKQRGVLS